MARNQTNFEHNKRIVAYDLGDWRTNVREALGHNWRLVLVSPWVRSRLPRDGIKFPTHKEHHLEASKSK